MTNSNFPSIFLISVEGYIFINHKSFKASDIFSVTVLKGWLYKALNYYDMLLESLGLVSLRERRLLDMMI